MRGINEGKQKADGDRIRPNAANLPNQRSNFLGRWPRQNFSNAADALTETKTSFARNERLGTSAEKIVKFRPRLPADFENILETSRSDQHHSPAAPLQQRIRPNGSSANQIEWRDGMLRQSPRYFREANRDRLRRISRRGRNFQDFNSPVANVHAIRESSPGIDCDAQFAPRLFFLGRQDRHDLLDMIQIVPGHQLRNSLDALFPALSVHSKMLPLFGAQRFQEPQICLAHCAINFERQSRILLAIILGLRPFVLIESGNRRSGRSENRTHAIASDDLRIRNMRQNFSDGPLSRRRALRQPGFRDAFDQLLELRGGGRLHFYRILSCYEAHDSLFVLLGSFWHRAWLLWIRLSAWTDQVAPRIIL